MNSADLAAVLKTALDAVVVMRTDGTVAGWNDVAERSFGWSFAEARDARMSDLIIPPQHREAHERGLARYLATGEGPVLDQHIEITAMHRDGREIPVELSITVTDQFGERVFLGFLRDITERHEAQRRQQLMMAELNHRVKNMLAVVAGIAQQTARASSSIEAFTAAFAGRLDAMARAHEILTSGAWQGASLSALLDMLLGPYGSGEERRVVYGGPDVPLSSKQVLSLSMIVHELVTNATKYGALADPAGRIAVEWSLSAGRLTLRWKESGLNGIAAPERSGFGRRMIAMSVGHELGGTMTADWTPSGLDATFEIPMDNES